MKLSSKLTAAVLASVMSLSALSGCSADKPTATPADTEPKNTASAVDTNEPTEEDENNFVGVTVTPNYSPDGEPDITDGYVTPTPTLTPDIPPVPTVTPDATPTPEPTSTSEPTPTPEDTAVHADNRDIYEDAPYILKETKDGGLDYQNRVVFLGDSTTYGLKPYGVLAGGTKSDQVWYGPNGTLALFNIKTAKISCESFESSMRVTEALEKYPPDILVITLGTNGVSSLDEEGFKEYYGWLIKTVFEKSPNTKVIAQSIYPISSYYQYQNTLNNKKITIANGWIRDLVSEYYNKGEAIYYLDTYNKLLDEYGEYMNLAYKNSASDGIHLNKNGHNAVLNNLRTHMIPS